MIPDVRRWRRWTWAIVAWTALAWLAGSSALAAFGGACDELEGVGLAVCAVGSAAGTLITITAVLWTWLLGFGLLALGWFARRPERRLCPPYGHPVARGRTACPDCGWDFVAAVLPAGERGA